MQATRLRHHDRPATRHTEWQTNASRTEMAGDNLAQSVTKSLDDACLERREN